MKTTVIYHSQTGNTRKVAKVMAEALGVEALEAARATGLGRVDTLFLGAAVYATQAQGLHPAVHELIGRLDAKEIGRVVLFSTGFASEGKSVAIEKMRGLLDAKGIAVAPESFFCKGRFAVFQLGHPNAAEFEAAAAFARETAGARTDGDVVR